MTKTHRSNLAKTAIYLLEKVKDEKFDMKSYALFENKNRILPHEVIANYNKCGTTCCFAGHAPMALGINPDSEISKIENWPDYISMVFGIYYYDKSWVFLFSEHWSNSKKQAAARTIVFLESGTPENIIYDEKRFLPSLTKEQLIKRLKPFVILGK